MEHARGRRRMDVAAARLPVEVELESLDGATGWLDSELLTPVSFAGRCRW